MKIVLLAALIVVPFGGRALPAAVTPPAAGTPALAAIVERTLARADAQQKALKSMQYDQTANVEQLDPNGKTTRREILEMIVRPGAHPEMQIVSAKGDNVPTNPDQARAQGKDVENNKQTFTLRELVSRFTVVLAGEEEIAGQRAFVLGFTPKPNQPYHDETEKVVNQLQGHMWISAKTYNVLRTEATLSQPVSIAWFVARIPTLDFRYTTVDSPEGFAPCQVLITLRVKAPFIDYHQRQTIDMRNFHPRDASAAKVATH